MSHICMCKHRRLVGGRQGEVVHRTWRCIGARAANGACFRRKAGFLLKLEVLEALSRLGVGWAHGAELAQTH